MSATKLAARRIVFIVHYFPPVNSTGAKRVEALSKYFVREGRDVTVITTRKTGTDGSFTEQAAPGVRVLEMDALGRRVASQAPATVANSAAVSGRKTLLRRVKDWVQRAFAQLPDPRLGFAFGFLSPGLDSEIAAALKQADVVIASMPPWPTHLAALLARWRFGVQMVLDFRDQFSGNHIMPGSRPAKWLEVQIDRALCRQANAVVAISNPMAQYYRAFNPNVHVILNGFDPEIIDEVRSRTPVHVRQPGQPLSIRYLGRMSRDRIPKALLRALSASLVDGRLDKSKLRFECFGECQQLLDHLRANHVELIDMFDFNAAVPYRQAIELMLTADYLLFAETSSQGSLSAQGVLTTKLFEYLACGRPILAEIAASTEAGRMIFSHGCGHFASTDAAEFAAFLGSPNLLAPVTPPANDSVRTLSRAAQALQYLELLDHLVGAKRA